MNNIQNVLLGELIRIKKGKKPLQISDRICSAKYLPYLLIESMEGQNKLFTDDSSCPTAKKEDTILVWDGARSGLSLTGQSGYVGSTLVVISKKSEIIDSRYLFYFISSKQKQIHYTSEGTGIPHVSRRFLENLQISIPPLPEQKKIAEILSGIDDLLNQLTLKIQSLYFLRKALFQRISSITSDSEKVKFGEIIKEIRSGWSPLCLPQKRLGDSPGVLKTTAIQWDGYIPSENKAVPKSLEVKNQAIVQEQDILCTRKGPMERVGVVCYVEKTPVNLMLPDTAFRIRISKNFNPKFIALVLATDGVQNVWHKKKIGLAEAQVNINHGIIKETEIPLPTSQIQDEIVEQMSANITLINNLKNQVESLTQLKRGLSSDLLSGRKRVNF